ncbi:MAG TPA: amino acid adenylation domain-containing protein, partial [Thermosynechococcaceae cyanobacterium]
MMNDLDGAIVLAPALTEAEIHKLLIEWRSPSIAFPPVPVHHAIETHAAQQPQEIALTCKDQRLTYAELNQRANQLAHYLHQLGVSSGTTVAVCVEPSFDVVVSLLGILKAGGVYVPLDPTYPLDRLTTLIEETQPQVLLTQSHLPSLIGRVDRIFCFDRDWETLQLLPTHNPGYIISLDQTAYLIYTSGTTGKPKGVMVSHRNLINYILVAQQQFGFSCQDVMPAIARFTFSITFFELLSPLVAGGTLVLLEREHILDFERLVQTLEQVTVVHTSPSLMRKLLLYIQENNLDKRRFQNLRHASCGGDMVPADLLETMRAVFQEAEIYVVYGCSEISCMGCAYPVPRDRPVSKTRVGKPFPNVSVRLYDPQQNLVSIGSVGEIYIGGDGVAQSYLHRDDLTQEKFVTIDGDRFYRTGDLGRFDSDGNLQMLGRNDFQIQLRGVRIEPGEIEATLRQQPGVREAVVVGRQLNNGEGLVAYVVLAQESPSIASLRQFLQSKLPDYMVPSIFVPLESLPLTLNGKLDRRSLPAPDLDRLGADDLGYIAPQTDLEKVIAEIWSDILGLHSVSIQDDFFALGGHSLLATQVVYRLREALKLDIAISRLFEFSTIATLAEYLDSLGQTRSSQADEVFYARFSPIVSTPRTGDCMLSPTQSNLWFLSQSEEGRALNIPLAFNLVGALHV